MMMNNEEAIRYWESLRKTFCDGRDHTKNEMAKEHLQTSIDAIDAALNALRPVPAGEPLTLEQLRDMDGQPVWIEDRQMPELSGWGIMRDTVCDGYQGVCFIEEYGKRWLAYAYSLAHIDREAWERCWTCRWVVSQPNWRRDYKFCPRCGKPLTEEAWAMLEKRLRGCAE